MFFYNGYYCVEHKKIKIKGEFVTTTVNKKYLCNKVLKFQHEI